MTSIERFTRTVPRLGDGLNGAGGALPAVTPAGALARRGRGEDPSVSLAPVREVPPEPPVRVSSRPQSSYLQHLPGIYLKNEFLGRFLLIFESILDPIDRQVGQLHAYFDPDTSPREMLAWIASWFGLVFDERLPDDRRRALVDHAAEIFAWRGTRRGLALLLRLTLGVEPEITEPTLPEIMRDPEALAWRFTVRITIPASEPIDDDAIHQMIEMHKPAAVAAVVQITRR
jgi:phage tail-like protein